MSKVQQFFDAIKEGASQAVEAVKDVASVAKDVGGAAWDAATPAYNHGAHEVAAAMFTGNAYVMYPRNQDAKDQDVGHGLHGQEAVKEPEQSRGGMEM